MEKKEIFKKAFGFINEEELQKALSTDAQKNFEAFVENNAENYACEHYFHPDDHCQSLEDDIFFAFADEEPDADEMENGYNYLAEALEKGLHGVNTDADADFDDLLEEFSIFVVKQFHEEYKNLVGYYHDYGEYSMTPSMESSLDEEMDTMQEWENESKEFHMNYGKEL